MTTATALRPCRVPGCTVEPTPGTMKRDSGHPTGCATICKAHTREASRRFREWKRRTDPPKSETPTTEPCCRYCGETDVTTFVRCNGRPQNECRPCRAQISRDRRAREKASRPPSDRDRLLQDFGDLKARGLRRCIVCKTVKEHAAFYASRAASDGRQSKCIECVRVPGFAEARDLAAARLAEGLKRCTRCETVKPLDAFATHRAYDDGRQPWCRECKSSLRPRVEVTEKTCSTCSALLPVSEFSRSKVARDGYGGKCAPCRAEYRRVRLALFHARNADADPYADPSPKRCTGVCKQIRPREDFHRSKDTHDGLRSECRNCHCARQAIRNAKKRGQWVEDVDRHRIWERDNGVCYLCEQTCDSRLWDLDHIDPIDNGGEHSYINTAVTHPTCNRSKGARTWPVVGFDLAA